MPAELLGKNPYDLIITDLLMPGWGGIELLKYLKKNRNQTPVMMMSSVRDNQTIREVFDLGVVGFLPKSYGTQTIVDAIEACRAGEIHVPAFYSPPNESAQTANQNSGSQIKLTRRQTEILSLMDQGISNQDIADKLFIGKSTVITHVSQIFKLFGVNSRIACLKAAKQSGMLG